MAVWRRGVVCQHHRITSYWWQDPRRLTVFLGCQVIKDYALWDISITEPSTHKLAELSIPLFFGPFWPKRARFAKVRNGIPPTKAFGPNSGPFWSFRPELRSSSQDGQNHVDLAGTVKPFFPNPTKYPFIRAFFHWDLGLFFPFSPSFCLSQAIEEKKKAPTKMKKKKISKTPKRRTMPPPDQQSTLLFFFFALYLIISSQEPNALFLSFFFFFFLSIFKWTRLNPPYISGLYSGTTLKN